MLYDYLLLSRHGTDHFQTKKHRPVMGQSIFR